MMLGSFEGQKHISVFETTLSIQQNTLSVFNIIIQTSQSTVSLIRYPFDLVEFHQKIRFHYPKTKISFPTLTNPSAKTKANQLHYRRSFRELFSLKKKSNADKVEKYLERCFQHPIISISSILRDFTSVQREEDALLTSQHTSITLTPTIGATQMKVDHTSAATMAVSSPSPPASSPLPPLPTSVLLPPMSHPPSPPNILPVTKPLPPIVIPPVSLNDYDLLQVLGKGCMGKVLLVQSKHDRQLYALKSIKKKWVIEQRELIHTRAERDILVRLRNQPFLANLQHVFQTPSELFLVLDYYAGGDIATQMSNMSCFSEQRTLFYAAEIVQGLAILHQHGIVYRDLKPENVLIGRDGHIVLTDFGLSKIFTQDDVDQDQVPSTQTFCGTAEYLAPEILLGEPYTFVVDFWSLGTLLYEMLAGTTPFWAETHMDMYKRVLEDPLNFPSHFNQTTVDFLTGLLEKEACVRLGWGEDGIEEIKAHPYFKSLDWNMVKGRRLTPPYIPILKSETDLSNFDEMFTRMPVRISQSSAVESQNALGEEDPFQDFAFDPAVIPVVSQQQPTVLQAAGPSTNGPIIRVRKRHSAVSIPTPNVEDNRVIKKRQTSNSHLVTVPDILRSPTISSLGQQEDSSVYSRSSLSFSFTTAQHAATRAGSELSIDQQDCILLQPPHERPHCPIPGQTRTQHHHAPPSTSHYALSNTSTINNSLCSYLTLDTNDHVVQHGYFPLPPTTPPPPPPPEALPSASIYP